jgi:3-oxoadipate enol-lactonase
MPYLDRPDGRLHYSLEGDGPPLTLIHGVGADLEAWDGVVASLAGRYRVLRPDLRGHGRSVKGPGPYSLRMFADDLVALLDRVSFETTHLAGFSLGGLIAQKVALVAPGRLSSLSIISSVAGRTAEEKHRVLERAAMLREEGALTHLANAVERWFTDEFREAHPEVLEWRRQKSLLNDPESYAAAYRVLAEGDLADRLHEIAVPTLAITGENDIGSTPRMSHLIAERVHNGRSVILPRLKHSVLLEAPERIAAELDGFISGVRP